MPSPIIAPRNPAENPTPLDRASWYIESLKYAAGPANVERVTAGQLIGQYETLLRDAGVRTMTGAQLLQAEEYYARSLAKSLGAPRILVASVFCDGLMHGIAFAAGLQGEPREGRTL